MRVAAVPHLHCTVVAYETVELAASAHGVGHRDARVNALACIRDRTALHELRRRVTEHAGVKAQLAVCAKLQEDRIRQAADAALQGRAVRHQSGDMLTDRALDRACS